MDAHVHPLHMELHIALARRRIRAEGAHEWFVAGVGVQMSGCVVLHVGLVLASLVCTMPHVVVLHQHCTVWRGYVLHDHQRVNRLVKSIQSFL